MRSLANWEANGNKIDPFLLLLAHNVHKQQSQTRRFISAQQCFASAEFGLPVHPPGCRLHLPQRRPAGRIIPELLFQRICGCAEVCAAFISTRLRIQKLRTWNHQREECYIGTAAAGAIEKYSIGPSSRWRDDISCSILSNTATELKVIIDPVLQPEWCSAVISLFWSIELLHYLTWEKPSFPFVLILSL